MSIFSCFPKKEELIKRTYEIDLTLYEKLEHLSQEIYDASSAGGKYLSTNTATIALFALNANGAIGNFGSNRIYECKRLFRKRAVP